MAKVGKQEIAEVKQPQVGLSQIEAKPEFLQELKREDMHGIAEVSQFVVMPRMKFVQKASGGAIAENFDVGDVIVMPSMTRIAQVEKNAAGKPDKFGERFFIVPLFFYPEWCLWNPIELRGTMPAIRKRTKDPRDAVALKAKNMDTWFEKCPELPEKNMRYVEHLNFICLLMGNEEFEDVPLVMSLARGEHKSGSNLCMQIRARKAPIYASQFMCRSAYRPSTGKGDWWGVDITPPDADAGVSSWVSKEMFDKCKTLHLGIKELHDAGKIQVDLEDDDPKNDIPY